MLLTTSRLEYWDFGDKFSFTELATFIMSPSTSDISTVVLVLKQTGKPFGSLYEVTTESDEISRLVLLLTM